MNRLFNGGARCKNIDEVQWKVLLNSSLLNRIYTAHKTHPKVSFGRCDLKSKKIFKRLKNIVLASPSCLFIHGSTDLTKNYKVAHKADINTLVEAAKQTG